MKAKQVSSISPEDSTPPLVSYPYQMGVVNPLKQFENDYYTALKNAMKAGSVSDAQKALAGLQQAKQSAVASGSIEAQSSTSQLSTNFQTLQKALNAGDINTAQKAFAAVDQFFQTGYTASIAAGQSAAKTSTPATQSTSDPASDPAAGSAPGSVLSALA